MIEFFLKDILSLVGIFVILGGGSFIHSNIKTSDEIWTES